MCRGLQIEHYFSIPTYPKRNGQVVVSNRIILATFKKRLESSETKWVDELPAIIWAFQMTPYSVTKKTPFSLAYGSKVVVLMEIGEPTLRISAYEGASNQQNLTTTITFFGIKA